ncbi:MAG: hypothetical protein AAF307_04655 [Pseudomonadota bacterium]
MSVFPLRASLPRLETFCNSYLNQAPHLVQFKPFIPFVYLVILDYGRMSLQAANMGWVSQREVAFGIPLRWLNMTDAGPQFHDWAFTSPYIFVDNELSMSTGREVYGWPKLIAKLDPSVSEWVRDPHGARRVFQVSTKRAAHAYAGEVAEERPFLSIHQSRAAGMFDIPPTLDAVTRPIQQLSSTAATMTRLSADLFKTFAGMASDGITGSSVLPELSDQDTFRRQLEPDKLKSWTNPKDWVPGLKDMLWSLFPRTYANTINFKQFRDAGDPFATCYQAITAAKMPAKSIRRGGFLGPQNMMLGQLDGGFRVDMHHLAGLPIVESLGLEVAEEREADGTLVSSLNPVCPLWMEVDMTYGLAETIVWRGGKDTWERGAYLDKIAPENPKAKAPQTGGDGSKQAADAAPTEEADSYPQDQTEAEEGFEVDYIQSMNFFNTTRGSGEAVGGAFTMPNASIRVLPIKADHAKMNTFVSEYLKVDRKLQFEAWGDYVYLIICDFDQVNSAMNAVASRRAREINVAVPVKCYDWFDDTEYTARDPLDPDVMAEKARKHLMTTGFVSAFSFVDDTGTAITASEVAGIPTLSAQIQSPENDWLSIDLSKNRAKRDILRLTASVLPALMMGAQAQERAVIELHSHAPETAKVHDSEHKSVNDWVSLIANDLEDKSAEAATAEIALGQGFALQILAGELPINQFSLKQFRDSRHTESACYQGLVQRRHRLQKLTDLRELEEPLHISITDYPTQPICELLGLKPKFSYPGPDRVVHVFEPLRPFSMMADLMRESGKTLFERIKSDTWQRGDEVKELFGWADCTRDRATGVVEKVDQLAQDKVSVELRYSVDLTWRDRPFRLHARKVSRRFIVNYFRDHLENGRITALEIRERFSTGMIEVLDDAGLLGALSEGEPLDVAAFMDQMRKGKKTRSISQADAAAALARFSPATVSDMLLSRQWGLSQNHNGRRKEAKPDFCVPSYTVPSKYTDTLFPVPERIRDYWPVTESYFVSQLNKRAMEVLSYKAEMNTLVGTVSSFVFLEVQNGPMGTEPDLGLKSHADQIRAVLSNEEKAAFNMAVRGVMKSDLEHNLKYNEMYRVFFNTVMPDGLKLHELGQERAGLGVIRPQTDLLSSVEWSRVRAAIPRLMKIAKELYEDRPDYLKSVQDISNAFIKRAKNNKHDMLQLEAAFADDLQKIDHYLHDPSERLRGRLAQLVTGGVLGAG